EAHVWRLANAHRHSFVTAEGIARQLQELFVLLLVSLTHCHAFVLRTTSITGLPRAPGVRLLVEVIEICEFSPGEEAAADVADRSFDSTLLVAACHSNRTRFVTVVRCQLQQGRVKAHGVATTLQHRALQIIVEQDSGDASKNFECRNVTVEKAWHSSIQVESQ